MVKPNDAIETVSLHLGGEPGFLAGSAVAAALSGKTEFHDVDVFVPTPTALMSISQLLLDRGGMMDDKMDRIWHRWKHMGLKGFHTNSMRISLIEGVEVNVVYKLVDGHPTTSLAQVLESFDFGLLGAGVDLEQRTFRDMRAYLFPDHDVDGPLPLMPGKRQAWQGGFISQYNGLRQAYRYGKYYAYGYDMSAVTDDLVVGYRIAAMYHRDRQDEDKQLLSEIYSTLANKIEDGKIQELIDSYQLLDLQDPLSLILETIE